MANKIQIKRSKTAGKKPTTLAEGELALNLLDKKIFTSDGAKIIELGGVNYASDAEVLAGTVTDKAIAPDTLAANSVNEKQSPGGVPGAVTIDLAFNGQQMTFNINNPNSLTELDADYEIKWALKGSNGTVLIPKGTKLTGPIGPGSISHQFNMSSTGTFFNQLDAEFSGKFFLMSSTPNTGPINLIIMGLSGVNATTFTFSFLLAGAGGSDSVDKWIKANSNGMLDNSLIPSLKNPTSTPTDDEDYLIRLDNTGHIHDGFLSELDAGNY